MLNDEGGREVGIWWGWGGASSFHKRSVLCIYTADEVRLVATNWLLERHVFLTACYPKPFEKMKMRRGAGGGEWKREKHIQTDKSQNYSLSLQNTN